MTYKEFAAIVAAEKPNLTVSQKSNTQNGGVLVTFRPGGKAYIYKGSYQQILYRLGIDKMGKREKEAALLTLKAQLDHYKRHDGKKGLFSGKKADYTKEIEDTESKIKELEINQRVDKMENIVIWEHDNLKRFEKRFQIMARQSSGLFHIFPGKLWNLEEAVKICQENNWEILAIGDFWHIVE